MLGTFRARKTALRLGQRDITPDNNVVNVDKDDNLIPFMRDIIIELIKNDDEIRNTASEAEKQRILKDLYDMPSELIDKLYRRIIHDTKVAIELFWEIKLTRYISENPQKFADAKGDRTPIQFLEDVWGPYMDRGVLYQDVLTDYDDKLIPAIYRYWNRFGRGENDRIPPPRQERTDAIIRRLVSYSPYSKADLAHAALAIQKREIRGQSR